MQRLDPLVTLIVQMLGEVRRFLYDFQLDNLQPRGRQYDSKPQVIEIGPSKHKVATWQCCVMAIAFLFLWWAAVPFLLVCWLCARKAPESQEGLAGPEKNSDDDILSQPVK